MAITRNLTAAVGFSQLKDTNCPSLDRLEIRDIYFIPIVRRSYGCSSEDKGTLVRKGYDFVEPRANRRHYNRGSSLRSVRRF